MHYSFNTCIPGDRFFVSPGGPHQGPTGVAGTIYPRPGLIFYADYEFWVVIFRISIINEIFESEIYSRYAGVNTCLPGDRFFVSPGGPYQATTGAVETTYPRPGPIFYAHFEFWVVNFRL